MKMKTQIRAALAATIPLVLAMTLAGCSDASTTPADPSATGEAQSPGMADIMFTTMMIPHHEQAIEMSDVVLDKDGIDPRGADLAERIKAAQGPEIDMLRGWLDAWGVDEAGDMSGMGHGDGMMSDADMTALADAPADEASRLFLEQMIVHHEGAVEMAEVQVAEGQDAGAIALAQAVIDAQTAEIAEMRELLEDL